MFGKKIVFALLAFGLVLAGCVGSNGEAVALPRENQIQDALSVSGVAVTSVTESSGAVTVEYSQPNADMEDVYANWAFIYGVVLESSSNSAALESITLLCNFEDGEKMRVTTSAQNARNFLSGSKSAWEFVYELDMESLTQGPQIWEG